VGIPELVLTPEISGLTLCSDTVAVIGYVTVAVRSNNVTVLVWLVHSRCFVFEASSSCSLGRLVQGLNGLRDPADREKVVGLIANEEINFEDARIPVGLLIGCDSQVMKAILDEKRDGGIKESISLEDFDGDVQTEQLEGFLCYLSQLEYGLSLPLSNLAKGIMNLLGACPVQMNGNMREFYGVKNYSVSGGAFFGASATRPRFFGQNSADGWKEVEEKTRLAALHGMEEMSIMAARLMKGICLGVEEERAELKRKKVDLERNEARLKSDLSKEWKRLEALKVSQVVEINKLQGEARVDLKEAIAERDRLEHYLISKGYSEDEVDAIRADTYVEEDEGEETEDVAVGVTDGLDGVELESADLREDEAHQSNHEFEEEFNKIKEANEVREDQHVKLDATLIREKVLERAIRGKEIVIKNKEELLKEIPDMEELNKEIEVLRAHVVHLEVINRAESAKADEKSVKNITFIDLMKRELTSQKARHKRLEDRL
ncbi:hypothetical protein GIB67_032476, partial [Kingdonia uniflora]